MASLEFRYNAALDVKEFLLRQLEVLLLEVKVTLAGDGYQVDVGVRHLETDDSHSDALAGDGFLYGFGNLLGKHHHLTEFFVIDIEDVVGFMLGDNEGMAFRQGIDVKKGKKPIVFGDFIAWDLATDDSGKDARHNRVLLTGDFEDFEDHFTGRDSNFSHFTDFLAEKSLSNGRIDRKLS